MLVALLRFSHQDYKNQFNFKNETRPLTVGAILKFKFHCLASSCHALTGKVKIKGKKILRDKTPSLSNFSFLITFEINL